MDIYVVSVEHEGYDKYEDVVYVGEDKKEAIKVAKTEANSYYRGKTYLRVWNSGKKKSEKEYYDYGPTKVVSLHVDLNDEYIQDYDSEYSTTLSRYLEKGDKNKTIITNSEGINLYCEGSYLYEGDYNELVKKAIDAGLKRFDVVLEVGL